MHKLVTVIKRKPGMAVDEFQDYWRGQHAQLVLRLPGLRRYVQSHTLAKAYRHLEPAADGIAEFWFDDSAALDALANTPALAAVENDEQALFDQAATHRLLVEEHVIKNGVVPPDAVKSIELVMRKPDMPVNEFQRYWREIHGPLGAAIPPILRYIQNHTRLAAYAGEREPALDGLAITWFRNTDAMRESATTPAYAVTRDDEHNFVREPLDFIITREHVLRG